MSTLTLDFTDSSFDDGLNNDGITEFVLSNNGGGLGVFAADSPMGPNDAYAVDNEINVAAGISAMEITTNAGTEFTFEFIDEDNSEDRTDGDSYTSAAMNDGNEVFTISMNEVLFADGLDITNGGSMEVTLNHVENSGSDGGGSPSGSAGSDIVSIPLRGVPHDSGLPGAIFEVVAVDTETLTGYGTDYHPEDPAMGSSIQLTQTQVDYWMAQDWWPAAPEAPAETVGAGGDEPTVITTSYLIGDEGGNDGETTWVVSGDMNGRVGTETDDSIGFRAGKYDGVFLGGDGFDTLKFSHDLNGNGQLFIDLTSGMGMFGNGQSSPIVKFAEIGPDVTYDLDWERLETEGGSNDFVIVGGGLNDESTNTSVARGGKGIADGYFELDLGSGDDTVMVTDSSSLIALDLSATDNQQVNISSEDGTTKVNVDTTPMSDVSGNDVSGNDTHASMGDHQHMEVSGEAVAGQAVVDFIDFGDDTTNSVTNNSSEGVVVDFGTAGWAGSDEFDATMSSSGSNMIDLRNEGTVSIDASGNDASGNDIISISNSADTIDIRATGVDAILVGDDTDTDVLKNHEHLYGDGVGVLGFDVSDVDGSNFDVVTSASLGSFNGVSNLQIFYDGDTLHSNDGDTLTRDAASTASPRLV